MITVFPLPLPLYISSHVVFIVLFQFHDLYFHYCYMHICRCIFKAESYREVKKQVFVNAEPCVLFGRRDRSRTDLILQP